MAHLQTLPYHDYWGVIRSTNWGKIRPHWRKFMISSGFNNTPPCQQNHRPAPSLSGGLDGGGNVFYTPCLLLATSHRIALAAAAAAPPPVPLLPPPPPPSSAAFSPEFSLAILGNGSRIGDKPVRVSLKLGKAGSMGRVGASTAGRSEQVCRLRCS